MADPKKLKLPVKLNVTTVLIAAVVLIILGELLLGTGGFVEIEPGEVAVVYNNTGIAIFGDDEETIVQQGAKTFLPGLQAVHVLERRPQVFVMSNDEVKKRGEGDVNTERSLTVRANDGSNFYFDRLEVHYQIVPSQAADVIRTSGPDDAFKVELLATYARQVLRDEFGRYDFLEIANPATYGAATTDAKTHLNEALSPLGVEVTQIVTPKPKFEARVEKAIEDRQNAEQEVEVQEEKRRKLEQEKGLKIQSIEQEKNGEYQSLIAELESRKKAAGNQLIAIKRDADKYFIDREANGSAYRDEKIVRAKANEVAYKKAAEGMVAKITAVGAAGPDVLNRVIAEKVFPQLKKVTATPLVKPATPIDIRHINRGGGQ
ncbi:MAG: SPFH domain-containing protein [Deltaproteobacteria bacterium]|jgi:regulator of protease activity HflC (stomatin/prohibitin superfamily)